MEPSKTKPDQETLHPQELTFGNVQVQSYRYVCLVVFFLAALVNSFSTNTLTAASITVETVYQQSMTTLTICSLADNLMMPILVFPASYLLDHVGLKIGLNVASFSMFIGQLMRLYIDESFELYVLGTFVSSIGSILLLGAPVKLVSNWFTTTQVLIGANQAPLINAALMFALYASDPLGIFVSVLIIDDNSSRQDISRLVSMESAVIVGVHLLLLLLLRERPKHSPKYFFFAQISHIREQQSQTFLTEIWSLVRNRNYLRLLFSLTFLRGTMVGLYAVFSWVVNPYGFGVRADGLIVFSSTLCGMLGCLVAGSYLQRTRKYRTTCMVCALSMLASLGLLLMSLERSRSLLSACVFSALVGMFMFPFISTITELSAECTFPVGEAMSTGCMIAGGELFGFGVGIVFEMVLDGFEKERSRIVILASMALVAISTAILIGVKEDLRKQRFEEKHKQNEVQIADAPIIQKEALAIDFQ